MSDPSPRFPCKSRDVARLLGVDVAQLYYLFRHGKAAEPPKDSSGDFLWWAEDVERVRAGLGRLARRRPRRPREVARA